tara:strand:+ start:1400 stop:2914 length:1515 start_codon:yes stop_codon:yes gene_type:complete
LARYLIGIFLIVFGLVFAGADHLVFDRITVTPTDAEIVSIYNPTSNPIDLSDYYITDSNNYYNLPSGSDFWSGNVSDFIARFPDNQFIAPNESLVLSLHTNQKFSDYYGYNSDLALFEDMRDAVSNQTTISFGQQFSSLDFLNDNTEMLMLFKWEEGNNAVQDIDYFIWGNTSTGVDKTGVSGYVEDTDLVNQFYQSNHDENFTYIRFLLNNSEGAEKSTGGNGVDGDDETSENFDETWNIVLAPELGCTNSSSANYNASALTDNGTCVDYTIGQVYSQYGLYIDEEQGCNENLSTNITTMGLIVDYQDKTLVNGPKVIKIQDNEGYQLELTIWDWDPLDSDTVGEYVNPYNSTEYYIVVNGTLGVYNCNFQLELSGEENIMYLSEFHPNGTYESDSDIVESSIDVEPYVLIPSMGEKINFSYSVPSGSRAIIRIFDLSGRFITSLVDTFIEPGQNNWESSWNGRDHLGQVLSPGTYLMHIESMNFQTGDTTTDVAPVVIGVKP